MSLLFYFGRVDKFNLLCPQLGKLSKIHIEHDNFGKAPGWYLTKVNE